jgi:type IV pilus assembly protein PilQ
MRLFSTKKILLLISFVLTVSSIGFADESPAPTEAAAVSSESKSSESKSETPVETKVAVAETTANTPAADTTTTDAPVSDATSAGVDAPSSSDPIATTGASSPGNVTVDFKNADIQNVLRILSFKSGVNIVAGKDVIGSVTIRLVDVPWEKALDVVLKTYGYAYDRDENIIRVTTLENLKKEELSTEVYTLNYAQAAEVEKSLTNILSERGKIRSDSRSNTIIVTDMPTTLQQVSRVIDRLDQITAQVIIHAKVIETTLEEGEKLGINWNPKVSLKGSSRPTTAPFAARARFPFSNKYFPDGRVSTVVITEGESAETEDFPASNRVSQPSFPIADKAEFQFGTLDFSEFQIILEAIKNRDDAKVLSEPRIVTLNNQEAKILVGEVIAIPTFERNATTGRMEITGYADRDLGIRLTVLPQINGADEIVVSIHPEITNLLGYDELTPEIKAPRFSTREAQTKVRIKNGQTIAIGGLIRETTVKSNKKVPFLGELPLLGKLFSHNDATVQKTDLIFFMTVNIVTDKAIPAAAAVNRA